MEHEYSKYDSPIFTFHSNGFNRDKPTINYIIPLLTALKNAQTNIIQNAQSPAICQDLPVTIPSQLQCLTSQHLLSLNG
jgi:hypothetical protein